MLINFKQPNKVEKIGNDFDGGPPNGYVPQMSDADTHRWVAKRFNKGKANDRIELRKSFRRGVRIVLFVALDGWDFSEKRECRVKQDETHRFSVETKGMNVRISMNGAMILTFDEFAEITQIVEEARKLLIKDKPVASLENGADK